MARRAWAWIGIAALAAVVGCEKVRYVTFGDSATACGYGRVLEDLLDEGDGIVANEGRGGERVAEGVERLEQQLSLGIYPNAEAYLWLEGGNDMLGFIRLHDPALVHSPLQDDYPFAAEWAEQRATVAQWLQAGIDLLGERGIDVVLGTYYQVLPGVCPCGLTVDPDTGERLPSFTDEQAANANAYIATLNETIREVAAASDVPLADLEGALSHPFHYRDCIHPSPAGNVPIAEIWYETLTGAGL